MTEAAQAQENITVTFPDGNTRDFSKGSTGFDVARAISKSLAKEAIAVELDGEICDLSLPINDNVSIGIIKRKDDAALELIRHDCAHVLAEAVQELFPGTQVTIGPSIENGFYYDFHRAEPFTTEDLPKIEKKMKEIIQRGEKFEREIWDRNEAITYFKDKGEAFKAELIQDLPESETITIYRQGKWLDLCRGPHMPSTKHVGLAFKLMKVAGAYWRGDSEREMLSRIYGTAWRTQDELDLHLHNLEEAEKRDHRKLGREMNLFHLQEEAQGSVFWHPKGQVIWQALEQYMRSRLDDAGYQEVKTPQLMHSKFWEQSGHWDKYREDMFVVPDVVPSTDPDGPIFKEEPKEFLALKPMNCPAHVQIFNQGIKSYRDLPIRIAEFGCCHRNEAHGALHGLMRVRQFTQDDAHIFCREDQILDESIKFCELARTIYKDFGFDDYKITFETRPEKRVGSDELWDKAEKALQDAMDHIGLEYTLCEGDGAFYGPKLGFIIRDAIGREWGCATLQLDFNLPERLDANYIGQDGNKHRPVMLHRAILGSIERFIGILIENFAGKLPLWLAPTQAVIATVTEKADAYAQELYDDMRAQGFRVELDTRNEKIGYKVREHSVKKVPVIYVLGAKEAEERTVSVRRLGDNKTETFERDEALNALKEECKAPA